MSFWDGLDARYTTILCDIWGVVHDGVRLFPHAEERLREWRGEGRKVILVTNAPRPASSVEAQLARIGLPRDCWDGISTSGEAGIAALSELASPPGFLGTRTDRAVLEEHGLTLVEAGFTEIAVTGLDDERDFVSDYAAELQSLAAKGVTMHCLNPDRVVHRGGIPEPCAGALADAYAALGGEVIWYGKPFETIYHHALGLAGDPLPQNVLAVGDALKTDMLGAALQGFDAVFVQSGIHFGEPWPEDFAAAHDLGDWHPVAIVSGLR